MNVGIAPFKKRERLTESGVPVCETAKILSPCVDVVTALVPAASLTAMASDRRELHRGSRRLLSRYPRIRRRTLGVPSSPELKAVSLLNRVLAGRHIRNLIGVVACRR